MTYEEVIEERGAFRVKIVADEYPQEPEFEAGCPVLYVPFRYYDGRVHFQGYGKDLIDGERALSYLVGQLGRWEGIEAFERWVRIFHGGDVTSFDSREGTHIAYTSLAHYEEWGLDPESEHAKADISEWQAYVEGDVWGVVVEEMVTTRTIRRDSMGRFMSDTTDVDWDEIESVWGYYGHEYAVEEAKREIEDYATTKSAS